MNKFFIVVAFAALACFAGDSKTAFKFTSPHSDDPSFVRSFITSTLIRGFNLVVTDLDTLFARVAGVSNAGGDVVFTTAGGGVPYASVAGNAIGWVTDAAVQNTWYRINDVDVDTSSALNSFTSNDSGQIIATNAGKYLVTWGATIYSDTAAKVIVCAIARNDTAQSPGQASILSVASQREVLASSAILYVPAGGKLQLYTRTTTSGTPNINIGSYNLSAVMVGR